jgi:hypothetical protein
LRLLDSERGLKSFKKPFYENVVFEQTTTATPLQFAQYSFVDQFFDSVLANGVHRVHQIARRTINSLI